jgi:TetR/AcrR family transcriptional repressor of nem operon
MGRTSDARQRLMDAAYKLIWEYSYGAVTIDAICERAEVKKGSFYYFFDSKSDLAAAAVDAAWGQRKKILEEMFQPEFAPLDRIRKYIDFVAQKQLEEYEASGQIWGCPIFTLGSEIYRQDEKIRAKVYEILTCLTGYFESAIRDAMAEGEMKGGDPAVKARALFNYFEGVLTHARIENNPEPIRTLTADAMAQLEARMAATTA